jgi:DNA-binding XRE family transcriptional regulator
LTYCYVHGIILIVEVILINRVQEYRNKQGYTQFELAEVSKVSFNTIQKLESAKGINADAYVSVALKLAKALGITVEELFKFE